LSNRLSRSEIIGLLLYIEYRTALSGGDFAASQYSTGWCY
jgi:hypothetical protein